MERYIRSPLHFGREAREDEINHASERLNGDEVGLGKTLIIAAMAQLKYEIAVMQYEIEADKSLDATSKLHLYKTNSGSVCPSQHEFSIQCRCVPSSLASQVDVTEGVQLFITEATLC